MNIVNRFAHTNNACARATTTRRCATSPFFFFKRICYALNNNKMIQWLFLIIISSKDQRLATPFFPFLLFKVEEILNWNCFFQIALFSVTGFTIFFVFLLHANKVTMCLFGFFFNYIMWMNTIENVWKCIKCVFV